VKIRIETIVHYMAKYSGKIMQQKLGYLSPECPLGEVPPFETVGVMEPEVIPEEASVAQPVSASAS
jgi:hypothetical protein